MKKKSTSVASFEAAQYVPALLSMLNNRLSSGASDLYLKHFSVGINEWRILTVMARQDECSSKFISEESATHLSVISRCLREMEKKGLVRIDSSSWQRSLSLTEEGRALFERIARVALQREKFLLKGVTRAEAKVLRELLLRLTANIKHVDAYDPARDEG